jgi:transposase-like protein
MSKRCTHSPEFKARVAMEAISGRKTLQEIAADPAVHPIQVSLWKKQLLEGATCSPVATRRCPRTKARLRRLSCSSRSASFRWSWSG